MRKDGVRKDDEECAEEEEEEEEEEEGPEQGIEFLVAGKKLEEVRWQGNEMSMH